MFPVLGADQLNGGAGQVCRGGQHIAVGGGHDGILGVDIVDHHIVHGIANFALIDAEAGSGVGLGVKIAQQHPQSQFFQGGGEVDGGGGLAYAAFLIYDGNGLSHTPPPLLEMSMFHVKHCKKGLFHVKQSNWLIL